MGMKSKWTNDELARLAKKHDLKKTTIYMIVMSQFEGAKEIINMADEEKNYFPSVRLPVFGLFKVSRRRLKYLSRKYYLKRQKQISLKR